MNHTDQLSETTSKVTGREAKFLKFHRTISFKEDLEDKRTITNESRNDFTVNYNVSVAKLAARVENFVKKVETIKNSD